MANENGSLGNGRSIAYDGSTLKTISTKYTTVYPHDSETDKLGITEDSTNLNIASNNNYALNMLIYGDAIHETSTQGTGYNSWYDDASYFLGIYTPFTFRGGGYYYGSADGLVCFSRTTGGSSYDIGFRAVVVVS